MHSACFKTLRNNWAGRQQAKANLRSTRSNPLISEHTCSEGLKLLMQLLVSSFLYSSLNLPFQLISCHSNSYLKLLTFVEHFMQFHAFISWLRLFRKLFAILHLKTPAHLLEPSSKLLSAVTSFSSRSVSLSTVFPVYVLHIYCLMLGFSVALSSRWNSQRGMMALAHLCILSV